MNDTIAEIVRATPFVDTHEHLVEESRRLDGDGRRCTDPLRTTGPASFNQYLSDDLDSAGMPAADATRFFGPGLGAEEKYRLRRALLGARQAHRLCPGASARRSAASTARTISRRRARRGLRRSIARWCSRASIARSSASAPISRNAMSIRSSGSSWRREQPDLLAQDLSFLEFTRCGPQDIATVERETGKPVKNPRRLAGEHRRLLRQVRARRPSR